MSTVNRSGAAMLLMLITGTVIYGPPRHPDMCFVFACLAFGLLVTPWRRKDM